MSPTAGYRCQTPGMVPSKEPCNEGSAEMPSEMLLLPRCGQPSGLETWIREAFDPFFEFGGGSLMEAPLMEMIHEVPMLLDPPATGCVWSGRLGSVACWVLRNRSNGVVARVATVPRPDGKIPKEIVSRHPRSYHQSAIGAGQGFLDQHPHSYDETRLREGPQFNGYILDDEIVGYLNIGRGERFFLLVAQFPGAGVVDYDGYWVGESLLARLDISKA
jgi:hypothetical protein